MMLSDAANHLLFAIGLLYFAPTLIALFRMRRDTLSIFVINLFLGWTFIGWVLQLARSVSPKRA